MVCLSPRDVVSTLKVIFRRPENVKPSTVSKRSSSFPPSLPPALGVSKFPSYLRRGEPPFLSIQYPPSFLPLHDPRLTSCARTCRLPGEKEPSIFCPPNPRSVASPNLGWEEGGLNARAIIHWGSVNRTRYRLPKCNCTICLFERKITMRRRIERINDGGKTDINPLTARDLRS